MGGETLLQRLHDRDSLRTLFLVRRMIFEKRRCPNPTTSKRSGEVHASRKLPHLFDGLLSNADDLDSWKKDSTVRSDRRRSEVK